MQIKELKSTEKPYQLGFRYILNTKQAELMFRSIQEIEIYTGKIVNTYYCVLQRYKDEGKAYTVKISTVYAFEKPENTMEELTEYDEYRDYFDSYIEAKRLWDEFKELRKNGIKHRPTRG